MFETSTAAEIYIPEELKTPGLRVYDHMRLKLHIPWFYIVYEVTNPDGYKSTNMIFLTEEEQILQIIMMESFKIIEAYLVSPRHINRSNDWQLERLKEIWEGEEEGELIYVIQNGKEYTNSFLEEDGKKIMKKNLVLSIKQ